jgi:hypothetical protein
MNQIIRISFFLFCLFSISKSWGQLPSLQFGSNGNASGCAPHSITFNISGISTNTANTTYQLNFGDGSPVLNYTQTTIPATVSHTYSSISCGQTFSGQQNCFGATLTATNSSGPTTAAVFPIRISKKPNASFALSESSICAGIPLTFSNISDPGVTYSGATCNTNSPYYWTVIGPSAGTLVSGIVGNNNGFPNNFAAWTPGSSPLIMQFNTPGSYQMKLSIGNSCGIDDTTLNFNVVNSSPALSLGSPGNTQQCAPANFDFTLSNFEFNSSETIYTVTYGDGGAIQVFNHPPPEIISHTFTLSSCGYTSISGLPDAFWVQISAQNSCDAATAVIEPIRISSPPVAIFNALPSTACVNNPVSINNSADPGNNVNFSGCNTNHGMVWSISPATGWALTSGTLGSTNGQPTNYLNWTSGSNQLSLTFSTPGNYTITQRIRNSCGEDLETNSISVSTNNNFVSAGVDQSLCLGSSPILLNGFPSGGIWSGNSLVNSEGVFSPNTVGSYSLVYSIGVESCLVSDELNIQVIALPNVAFALEDTLFCTSDAAITLTSGTPPGGVYFGSGVNGNQFDPSLTFVGESTIGYSYTDFNGCSNLVNESIAVEICALLSNSDKSKSFHVYPNPSSGLLNIQLQEWCSFAEISIFSIDGQLIAQKQLNDTTQSFDFSLLPSGVYRIQLQNKEEIISLPWYKFN